jgi:hypothetical protein
MAYGERREARPRANARNFPISGANARNLAAGANARNA